MRVLVVSIYSNFVFEFIAWVMVIMFFFVFFLYQKFLSGSLLVSSDGIKKKTYGDNVST